ncbi:MAG: DEAD/DEAH box helicase, partial [Chloroflexi bacterium]|nr:DEAD/DEAH box helicase [Chloroflexota bacterium]
MTLIPQYTPPMEDVWVSLDLETTGLSNDNDEIIEIGAVKFQGGKTLDTFQTFVNPNRRLDDFILRYTGITQNEVDNAPSFSAVAGKLASFIGSAPVIGHNIAFDLGFLDKKGLRLPNPRCDTWDMAYVLLPGLPEYSLGKLAASLNTPHPRPHRALEDALVTMEIFNILAEKASELDVFALAEMQRLAGRSSWVLSYLLRGLEAQKLAYDASSPSPQEEEKARVGIAGLDNQILSKRLQQGRALRPNQSIRPLDVDFIASMLQEGSPLAEAIPGFDERPEQVAMARAVAEAINEGKRLIVEAGTGVGKSIAYLLPALMYAAMNNKRVVVSTNTINLQEQLLNKDVPTLLGAMADSGEMSAKDVKFTQLKGRANYLCLRRWSRMRSNETLSENEARMLAKTMVWLQDTATGDRSELNLGHRSAAAPWDRLSAQGATECLSLGGPCFLRAARERAAASHLVIVNHALLLSDVTAGGTLIPEYDILIVDEAHHLEEEATRHLGFELGQSRFDEHIQSLSGERGLFNEAVAAFRGSSAAATRRESVEKVVAETTAILPGVRDHIATLFTALGGLLNGGTEGANQGNEFRVTTGTRAQPGWSELEAQWENVDVGLTELGNDLRKLQVSLEGLEEADLINYEGLLLEIANAQQVNADLRQKLAEFVPQPKPDGIYWVTRTGQSRDLTLRAAPLHVGETLNELLFSQKECVVLTSATLSTNQSFSHIRERIGFDDADELLVGSPFDYPNAALICVPEDMPEPNSWAYQESIEQAISDAALAVNGRTMALFTSHASLQTTASAIRGNLQSRGITVL